MKEMVIDSNLVSACGFYCGACKSFLKGTCNGCASNNNFWARNCTVKQCCSFSKRATCADCNEFDNVEECSKLNSSFIRFFGYFVGYSRPANIKEISRIGTKNFAVKMAENKTMWMKDNR